MQKEISLSNNSSITRNYKNKNAFTLVEIIIVVTILWVLASIAFISFQSYSKNARDWVRLATLKNIETWLSIYYTKINAYPNAESWTLIQSSWWLTTIWTQWYFWDINSRLLKFSKTPTDPYDGNKYIYSVNATKNKYQIMWFLETSDYVSLLSSTYAATDYFTRIPKTLWDSLWILLDSSNNPISWASIDIEKYNWLVLKAIFDDKYSISWTWLVLKWLKSTFKDWKMWKDLDKNCDLPDVVIWSQVWAWCNSTLWYWAEWWQLDSDIWTSNYNWVISRCNKYSTTELSTTIDCPAWVWSMMSNSKESNWNWASWVYWTVNNIWWKFYSWNSLNTNCKWWDFTSLTSNNNCPCPTWWHIPTYTEWQTLESTLWCTNSYNTWAVCAWLWWNWNYLKGSNNNMIQALKLPLPGRRDINLNFYSRGSGINLWSSSKIGDSAYRINPTYSNDTISHWAVSKYYGYSVRCIKD